MLCFCTSSLALNERLDVKIILFEQCVIKVYLLWYQYFDCLLFLGCPRVVRTDPGTENVLLASLQCTLRRDGPDELAGNASHRYGKSVFNQVPLQLNYSQTKFIYLFIFLICLATESIIKIKTKKIERTEVTRASQESTNEIVTDRIYQWYEEISFFFFVISVMLQP